MINRNPDRIGAEISPVSTLLPKYELDKEKHVLKQVGEYDLQKMIDSCGRCTLDYILDHALNADGELDFSQIPPDIAGGASRAIDLYTDRLEVATKARENIESMREEFHLSPLMTDEQVLEYGYKRYAEAKATLVKKKKGGSESEKIQVEQTAEPQNVPPERTESESN